MRVQLRERPCSIVFSVTLGAKRFQQPWSCATRGPNTIGSFELL